MRTSHVLQVGHRYVLLVEAPVMPLEVVRVGYLLYVLKDSQAIRLKKHLKRILRSVCQGREEQS